MDDKMEPHPTTEYLEAQDNAAAHEYMAADSEFASVGESPPDSSKKEYFSASPRESGPIERKPFISRQRSSAVAAAAVFALTAITMLGIAAYSLSGGVTPSSALPIAAQPSAPVQPSQPPSQFPMDVPAGAASSAQTDLPPVVDSGSVPGESAPQSAEVSTVFTVVFDLDGGRVDSSIANVLMEISGGESVAPPQNVAKDGFIFRGWVTERGGSTPAQFDRITADTIVYAKWQQGGSLVSAENLPKVTFQYRWNDTYFQPYADISWASGSESAFILWQLYDPAGKALEPNGRIDGEKGNVEQIGWNFDIKPLLENGLYPKGYCLRLTPHLKTGTEDTPLSILEMELPYFEAVTQKTDGRLQPVISTNVGFYFKHSYDSLSVQQEEDTLRITGSLFPLLGEQQPLEIDVSAKSS